MSISTTALDRRSAVKIAAAASLLAAGGACIFMVDAAHAEDEGRAEGGRETGPYAGRVGFLVKPHNCLNCQACVEACRKFNKTPESRPARRHITKYEKDGEALFVSTSCMHCEEPACASVCPAGAIKKAEDGVVYVDKDRCIGCKYCYQACPFGVPQYSTEGMDKCDCCLGCGVPASEEPHCVQACMFDALKYGKLIALERKSHGAAQRLEASTDPSFLLA